MINRLGCMNRAWEKFTLPDALSGIEAAGFTNVSFCSQQGVDPVRPDSSEAELDQVQQCLDETGLSLDLIIGGPDIRLPDDEIIPSFEKLAANLARVDGKYAIACGVDEPALYEKYYRLLAESCDAAATHGIGILLKPHGGIGAAADELLMALDRIDRPNFGICYDPGNILYYTEKRPEEDLPKIADRIEALCLKDERGGLRGEVMITLGTGDVDFDVIFSILRGAGFKGTTYVECMGGNTLNEINTEAKDTIKFLQDKGVITK